MHHFFLARLVLLLSHYGYIVLFPAAIIEGPVAAAVAGAFVASGEFDFFAAFVILVLADMVGDSLYYSLGRFSHKGWLRGIGKHLGITTERAEPLREGFAKHNWKLLLLGKTQALGSIILYFAGATRMSYLRFVGWNFIGTLPKVLIFELVGFFLGQSVINSTRYVNYIGLATFAFALLLIATYWIGKRYVERELEKD